MRTLEQSGIPVKLFKEIEEDTLSVEKRNSSVCILDY